VTITDLRDITSFKWATVATSNPLSIKLDGDSAPLALIPDSLVDPLTLVPGDRVRVELSLRKAVIHGVSKGGYRGTTAERNARFGVPIRWFNTDLGWEESYYADTTTPGLTVLGLVSGTASGWYPTGFGPEITMNPTATASGTTGNYLGGWNGIIRRKGGAACFTYDSLGPKMLIPGYYDLAAYTVQSAGTGLADYHVRLLNSAGTVVEWQSNLSGVPLSTSYFTQIGGNYPSTPVGAGQRLVWLVSNGSLTLHNTSSVGGAGRGQLTARYVRPLLVSD
jgi:hypothetical protein